MVVDYLGSANSVNIPEDIIYQGNDFEVTAIGGSAFENNNLTSVDIPDSVNDIGGNAFRDNLLTEVTSIGNSAFLDNNLTEVTIPNNVTDIERVAFSRNPINKVTVGRNAPPRLKINTAVYPRGCTYLKS